LKRVFRLVRCAHPWRRTRRGGGAGGPTRRRDRRAFNGRAADAKRNAIVRRLGAVETLGSANVIASDKTGTLTKNEMTVRTVVTASGQLSFSGTGYAPEGEVSVDGGGAINGAQRVELDRALAVADRANNAVLQERDGRWTVQGDPTEGALIVAARKAGLESEELKARFKRVGEVPFSSERKLMSTVHTDAQRHGLLVFTKGAPDVLLTRCSQELAGEETRTLSDARRKEILAANEELAGDALRTLGIAFRSLAAGALEGDEMDERLEHDLVFAGLIGMIDPPRNEAKDAVARAKGAGIRPVMITGDHPRTAAVIAQELGITSSGRVVTGAELEKMQSDALVETVREISVYARVNPGHKLQIVKALQGGGAVVAMTGDGAPALALGIDPSDAEVMERPPRSQGEGVITRRMWGGIFFVAAVMAAGTLLMLDASLPGGLIEGSGNMRYAQTMAFTTLVLAQLFNVFNARSDERSAFRGLFENHWLWTAIGLSLALQMAVVYTPFLQQAFSTMALSSRDWLRCALVASSVLWMRELSKIVLRAIHGR
jgi:magnesium-transporting ATPase (P-type)